MLQVLNSSKSFLIFTIGNSLVKFHAKQVAKSRKSLTNGKKMIGLEMNNTWVVGSSSHQYIKNNNDKIKMILIKRPDFFFYAQLYHTECNNPSWLVALTTF